MQSDGVVDGTEDWETAEAEGPHGTTYITLPLSEQADNRFISRKRLLQFAESSFLNNNAPGAGAPGF